MGGGKADGMEDSWGYLIFDTPSFSHATHDDDTVYDATTVAYDVGLSRVVLRVDG